VTGVNGWCAPESEAVWVALPYTRMYLDKMANTLCDHVAGRSEVALKDVLNDVEWAAKLMGVMEFAARHTLLIKQLRLNVEYVLARTSSKPSVYTGNEIHRFFVTVGNLAGSSGYLLVISNGSL
jgi:hypothetical protein